MGKRGFCCHYNDGVETGIVYFYVIHSDIIKAYMIYNLRVFFFNLGCNTTGSETNPFTRLDRRILVHHINGLPVRIIRLQVIFMDNENSQQVRTGNADCQAGDRYD